MEPDLAKSLFVKAGAPQPLPRRPPITTLFVPMRREAKRRLELGSFRREGPGLNLAQDVVHRLTLDPLAFSDPSFQILSTRSPLATIPCRRKLLPVTGPYVARGTLRRRKASRIRRPPEYKQPISSANLSYAPRSLSSASASRFAIGFTAGVAAMESCYRDSRGSGCGARAGGQGHRHGDRLNGRCAVRSATTRCTSSSCFFNGR